MHDEAMKCYMQPTSWLSLHGTGLHSALTAITMNCLNRSEKVRFSRGILISRIIRLRCRGSRQTLFPWSKNKSFIIESWLESVWPLSRAIYSVIFEDFLKLYHLQEPEFSYFTSVLSIYTTLLAHASSPCVFEIEGLVFSQW